MAATETAKERVERLRAFEALLRRDVRLVVEVTLDSVDAEAPSWRRGVASPMTHHRLAGMARTFETRMRRLLEDRYARLAADAAAVQPRTEPDVDLPAEPGEAASLAFLAQYRQRLMTYLRDAIASLTDDPCPPQPPLPPGDTPAQAGDVAALVEHLQRLRRRLAPDVEDLSVR